MQRLVVLIVQHIIYCTQSRTHTDIYRKKEKQPGLLHLPFQHMNQYCHVLFFFLHPYLILKLLFIFTLQKFEKKHFTSVFLYLC